MTSAGGLVPLADAVRRPASLLLSGPAGGVRAAAVVAEACGFPDAVAFDMGGTSTDVCLVRGGVPAPAPTLVVAGYPIRLPALAIHTIGAGGGSIARLDTGGALVVGPESAGADPGPACYGRGGERADRHRRRPRARAHPRRRPRSPGSAASMSTPRAPRSTRAGVTRRGCRRGGRRGDGARGARRHRRAGRRSAGARAGRVRWRGAAARVRGRRRARHARGDRPAARRCVLGRRARVVAAPPRAGAVVADAGRRSPGSTARSTSWRATRRRRSVPPSVIETFVDCRYAGQSHELTVPRPGRLPGRARAAQRVRAAGRAGRGRRAPGARVARRAAHDRTASRGRARRVSSGPTSWSSPTARVGARRLGRRAGRARRVGDGARVTPERLDPAALQILISRLTGVAEEMGAVLRRAAYSPNIKERADCSAALFTAAGELLVQAEHIPVHLGSMPAAVRGGDRGGRRVTATRRRDGAQRSVRRRHAPQRRHARRRRASCGDAAGRLGGEPRAPRRPRRDGAGLDAARRDRDLRGGAAHPAGAPRRRRGRDPGRELAHARRAARRPRRAARRQPARRRAHARRSWTRSVRRPRSTRSSTTASGACAPRSAALPDGGGAFEDVLDSAGPAPDAAVADADRVDGDGRRRRARRSTSPAPTRSAPGNVNAVEAVTVSAVAFAVRAATDPTIPANGGAMRPVRVIAPRGHGGGARSRRSRSARATSR